MKKTLVTYLKTGDSTHYSHTLTGGHFGKDNAQLELLKLHIGCVRVLSVKFS